MNPMREILFRGKMDNGEWVYGSFSMDALEQFNGLCGVDGFIRLYDKAEGKMKTYEVDRETVGQYTGLKDKNGERIFDGDIVQAHFKTNHSKQIFRVAFDYGTFIFNNGHVKVPVRGIYRIKVIGNIHDNPEFMKKGADND